jgi:hypothetical protein
VRLRVCARHEIARERLHPDRVDRGDRAGEESARLDQLGRHDDLGGAFREARSREDHESLAARAEVVAFLAVPDPDAAQQTGEEGAVDGFLVDAGGTFAQPDVAERADDLAVEVLPLAHAEVIEELGATHPAERGAAASAAGLVEVIPQLQEREEVARRVGEAGVRLIGRRAPLEGALARILDGESRDDGGDLADDTVRPGLDEHPAEAHVDGQPGELPADRGERGLGDGGDRPEFAQQVEAVAHAAPVRGLQERECGDVAEPERHHLQDDGGEVGAQDLGIRERGAALVVLLRVETDRDPVARAAGATGPLVRARLADRLDGQPLHLRPRAVARDAGGPGVHDVLDTGDGEARLGDVRREHDAPPDPRGTPRVEDAVLVGGAQPSVQRHDLGRGPPAERLLRVPDLRLSRQEHEHVSRGLPIQLIESLGDPLEEILRLGRTRHPVCS